MNDVAKIIKLLEDMNLRRVSIKAKVSYAALSHLVRGRTEQPTFELVTNLQKYFKKRGEL